ncbi:MAG: PASTA domain-containing protein [Candidatus Nanopelagicales bacterium]
MGEAEQILKAAGFKVNVNSLHVPILNRVFAQSPGGGSQVPEGSTITITAV